MCVPPEMPLVVQHHELSVDKVLLSLRVSFLEEVDADMVECMASP